MDRLPAILAVMLFLSEHLCEKLMKGNLNEIYIKIDEEHIVLQRVDSELVVWILKTAGDPMNFILDLKSGQTFRVPSTLQKEEKRFTLNADWQ